jgi:hypothetical protein
MWINCVRILCTLPNVLFFNLIITFESIFFLGIGGRVRFYSLIKFEGTKRVDGVEFWVGNKSNFSQRKRKNDNGLI